MKFTLPLTLLAVLASVDAAPAQEEDKRWCSTEGQPCDTVKRAADAFTNALRESASLAARDESSSETAHIARSQINELALAIAASQADPLAFYRALHFTAPTATTAEQPTEKREAEPWCTFFLGQPCWKNKRSEPAAAEAQAVSKREANPQHGWCTFFLGQPCWKRSEAAAAEEQAVSKREAEPQHGWCTFFLGQPCWKRDAPAEDKRMADPMCSRFVGESCYKRDGSAAAAEERKRCESEGNACWTAKRAANAVINTIDAANHQRARRMATDPQFSRRAAEASFACHSPDGACNKATRDLHAMYNAARSIIEA
ncbi:7f567966-09a5-4e14-a214-a23bad27a89a [Thermothielavioides terrestris]|uniref:7f567966-09a5-4e14-a214-a23bad27a89a n=1 Tax=Thermothielavioides terrestris TaxID=2587410 RepID=A0A446B7Q1_9PEZI|nr:7f567966-09a5-4e14-a214-a23bad27a89a [Thermothielavioides terrestris]